MAAAGAGARTHVLEIYTQNGLAPYCMKPVNNGKQIFGGMDIRQPEVKDRVKIHSDMVALGILFPVLGDSDYEYLEVMPPVRTHEMPHVTNDNFQFVKVYDNHPKIEDLISKYQAQSQGESTVEQTKLEEYCKEIKAMTYAESSQVKSSGRYWSAPGKRNDLRKISMPVHTRVERILKAAKEAAKDATNEQVPTEDQANPSEFEAEAEGGAAAAAAIGQGGSRRRRHRRPSRKYKKSKRVLRRKSRSTRRR